MSKKKRPKKRPLSEVVRGDMKFPACDILLAAEGEDDSLVRPFEMVAYSGGKLFVAGFQYPVVVDLGGVTVKASQAGTSRLPVVLDHEDNQRVGTTDEVEVTRTQIRMRGRTNAESEARREVVVSARQGYVWQASIYGRVNEGGVVKAGQFRFINGQRQEGPFVHAKKFTLRNVSFVTQGGDEANHVQLAAAFEEINMTFEKWLEAKEFVKDDLSEGQLAALQAAFDAENTEEVEEKEVAAKEKKPDPAPITDPVALQRELAAAEAARIASITKDVPIELRAQAISENWDKTKIELEILRSERDNAPAGHVHEKPVEVGGAVVAALCRSAGVEESYLQKEFSEKELEASDRKELRGFGLHALLYETCRQAGKYIKPGKVDNEVIRAAFEADAELKASGYSTMGLTQVLEDAANKALLSRFTAYPAIAPQVCAERSVPDFKTCNLYRVQTTGYLQLLPTDGEIKHSQIADVDYTHSAKTYASMLSINRQHLVNDDLGAFNELFGQYGWIAAKTLDNLFHTTLEGLVDTATFASTDGASNGGVINKATSALGIAGLTAAELLSFGMKDLDGVTPVVVRHNKLLVPGALGVTARQLCNDTMVHLASQNASATAYTSAFSSNPHAGRFTPIISPWLSDATDWFLFPENPNEIPAFVISYLQGKKTPTIESAATDFNTLGVQTRCYFDINVDSADPRGVVFSEPD